MSEAKMYTDQYKVVILNVAADLLDSLVQVLDEQGIQVRVMKLNMNDVPVGQMSPRDLGDVLRMFADEFRRVQVDTTAHRAH